MGMNGDHSSASGMDNSLLPTETADIGASQLADVPSLEDKTRPHTVNPETKANDVSVEADGRMNVPKPWKEKKKTAQNRMVRDEIEIFEGKNVVGPSHLEITSPDKGYFKIICKDDSEFLVPRKVVESFECVDIIFHGDAIFKEKLEDVIRFPDIQPEIMEYVLRFVFIEHLNKLKAAKYWGPNSPRLVFQFEVNPLQVMDLIYVAHFLGIKDLLDVTATMVARHLQDVPDLSSMPVDLAWCVAKKFTAQELFEAEERQDFLSLVLDTDVLWEKHCNKFLVEDIIKPTRSSENPPSYHTWGFSEGPAPTSWKSLYIALDLQQLADRQDGSSNESFFAEIQHKGKYAYSHTIRPMFYEWVLRGPGSLPLCSYLDGFPNLTSLHLVKLPLGSPSADGAIPPCLFVEEILQRHPQLQILDVSETGFTTEAAILLSRSLLSHPRLQALRLAYNTIGPEGFSAIAEALPHLRTLKYLDVRGNKIASAATQEAVVALQSSGLEELLLNGNLAAGKQLIYTGVVTEHRGRSTVGFSGVTSRGNGLFWDLRGNHSNANGGGTTSVSEPEEIRRESLQAQSKPFQLMVPLLSGIPPNLKKMHLAQCDLVDTDMSTLVEALRLNNSIQKLDLSDNSITAPGASSIFVWLQGNDSLLELNFSNNNITDSCSSLLLKMLQSHVKLQKLTMRGNYTYGEQNLAQIINAGVARGEALVSTCGLRFTLDLYKTEISFSTRAIIQRQADEWRNKLDLLI